MAVDDSYTKVLLHFDGADASTTFTDESGKVWTAAGDAQLSTSDYKFGSAAGLFDGTGDYITTLDHDDFDLGSGNFAIDFWVKFSGSVPAETYFCGHSIDTANYYFFRLYSGELNFVCEVQPTGSIVNISRVHGFAIDTWYHVAVTRYGDDYRLFKNGVQLGATLTAAGALLNGTGVFAVGSGEYNGGFLTPHTGRIEEFRFTKGHHRWITDFTPPSSQYSPNPNITLEFTSTPLSVPVTLTAEAMFLDFGSTALSSVVSISFGEADIDMADAPLAIVTSFTLDEPSDLDFTSAALAAALTISDEFEARGSNFITVDLPVLVMESVLTERSLSVDADFPALDMGSTLLVGELLEIETDLPSLTMTSELFAGVSSSILSSLPTLRMQSYLLVGESLSSLLTALPALTMVSTLYLVPSLTMSAEIPAFEMGSIISIRPDQALYRGVAINLKTMAVTEYRDFNFNSLCKFNGIYLGANDSGIYVLGSDQDAGTDISWSFKTPKLDLLNSIPRDLWLFMRNKNAMTVEVEQNENPEDSYTYDINLDMDPLIHQERVKLGRGLNLRVMQLNFAGTGKLDLNKIAVTTNPVKKTKR